MHRLSQTVFCFFQNNKQPHKYNVSYLLCTESNLFRNMLLSLTPGTKWPGGCCLHTLSNFLNQAPAFNMWHHFTYKAFNVVWNKKLALLVSPFFSQQTFWKSILSPHIALGFNNRTSGLFIPLFNSFLHDNRVFDTNTTGLTG